MVPASRKQYGFDHSMLKNKIERLSGGEKNVLQIAKTAYGNANLLLLDEPTSHLDTYAQVAFEEAVKAYTGTIVMVSHDFYTIANCMDYILYVNDKTVRRMSMRAFRKMIYANHLGKDYLELEQKKKVLEARIEGYLKNNDYKKAIVTAEELEGIITQMSK